MTPCPPYPFPCDIWCDPDPCPANQSCFRIADGYHEGYCTWTPPYGAADINCDQFTPPCCCHCIVTGSEPECATYVQVGHEGNIVDGCEEATLQCKAINDHLIHNEPDSQCCTLSEPKNGTVITMTCNTGGVLCTPCNRVATPRFPVDNSKPYPLSDYFAPCYAPFPAEFADESDTINKPIRPDLWNEVFFTVDGVNPCAELNKCRGSCRVYSQCSFNPETATIGTDQCKVGRFGEFCYDPNPPGGSECAMPVSGSCIALCGCGDWGPPQMTYNEFFCDGLGPIPYCTFSCPPEPCTAITCPPGYYCDNYAYPLCQPL